MQKPWEAAGHRKALIFGIAAVLVCVLLALAMSNRRVADGVTVGGLEVGGMTRREAGKALKEAAADTLLGRAVEIVLPEETLRLEPEDCGLRFSASGAARDACRLSGGETALGLLPYLRWEGEPVRQLLADYGGRHDTALAQPHWELTGAAVELSTEIFDPRSPGQTLKITTGVPERTLNVEDAYGAVLELYDRAFAKENRTRYSVTIEVPPEKLPEEIDLEKLRQAVCAEPVDDGLDLEAYQVIFGAYGCEFDAEAAKELLARATEGETVEIQLEYTAPGIMGDGVYFRDVLGTCETRHNDNENRNTNLRLICEILDGHVVEPGQDFSYNGVVGERTKERGFKPAPAFSGNRLVQDYGGGACQCSTTLYNCLLLADMEVTARVCHGASVGYVPKGLDAAVNWATNTDLAFRNNSHFPVKIRARVEDGYVKMELLGTDEKDYYIEMESASGEDDVAIYAVSYKCKYSKATGERISREAEARSTYYKNFG